MSQTIHPPAHYHNAEFNDNAIAQYMRVDFITLDALFSVALARDKFLAQLNDDAIPAHLFIDENGRLAGMVAVRKLLQESDTAKPLKALMLSHFLPVKPDDERADVAALLAHSGTDVVPVVD
ncbi:hypothetical protein, partial [Rhizobium laguerreae]|uniref:hypothetical protein n=1 Tax=Rhizobium laguerreae TaxID=1076926 RepID=UPI001A8D1F8F